MLLPHRELEWDTGKCPENVIATIRSMTEPTTSPWKKETRRLFWGIVDSDSFQIGLHIGAMMNYSMTILIHGSVSLAGQGSHLSLKLGLNEYARTFMGFWFGGVAFFFFISLLAVLLGPSKSWVGPLTAIGMFLFALIGVRIVFKRQADRAVAVLREIFPE